VNVLVVGGAGYVGGHLCDQLISQGYRVHVVDTLLYEDQYLKPISFELVDVRDTPRLLSIAKNFDAVVWLAALVGDPACALNKELTFEINSHSIERFASNWQGRFVFMSTCSVYGAQVEILNESSSTNPLSFYAESKLLAESFISNRPNTLIFRLGTLFGVGDNWSRLRLDLAINVLTLKGFYNRELEMFGGEQWRPFLHVKDVGDIIAANINNSIEGTFNLATENITISNLVNKVTTHIPGVAVKSTEISFQDARNYRVSNSKAKELLDIPESRDIDYGINEILKVLSSGRISKRESARFSNVASLKESGW
jgi:nucleoside-diphosphate-sugar epimerase